MYDSNGKVQGSVKYNTIYDKRRCILGYVNYPVVYDVNYMPIAYIENGFVYNPYGMPIGYYDANNHLYDLNGQYLGYGNQTINALLGWIGSYFGFAPSAISQTGPAISGASGTGTGVNIGPTITTSGSGPTVIFAKRRQ